MKSLKKLVLFCTAFLIVSSLFVLEANAQVAKKPGAAPSTSSLMTGTSSIELAFSYTYSDQSDINGAISDANKQVAGGISTKDMSPTYEFSASWIYRFDRTNYALVLRPSYLWQETDGSGSGGNFNYKISGFTLFPMLRIFPIETSFMKFFIQGGVGYGSMNGDFTTGANSLQFKGSAFGAVGGIGADFCFNETNCLTVEGNLRYLPIERNISTGGSCYAVQGTNTVTSMPGISQCGNGQEVERNLSDFKTNMSGLQATLAYTINF